MIDKKLYKSEVDALGFAYVVKEKYGTKRGYIKDKKIKQAVTSITGKQTISDNDIKQFKKLGVNFILVNSDLY